MFARALADVQASTIHLRINSPGGDVFDARAIKTTLDAHSARVVAHIDGLAASAASMIMLAADEIEISSGAFIMIHNAWGFAIGDAAEMRATASLLDEVDASLVRDYAAHTGKSADQIKEWMAAETWFEAHYALENGFADRIAGEDADTEETAQALARHFDLALFERAPAFLTAAPTPQRSEQAAKLRARFERRLALYERLAA